MGRAIHLHLRALLIVTLGAGAFIAGCMEEPEPASLPGTSRRRAVAERANAAEEAAPEARRPEPAARPLPQPPGRPAPIPAPEDVAAPPPDAQRTASGLATKVLQAGTGTTRPGPHDGVSVHYTGWRAEDGAMFDSSVARGRPASFSVDGVIPGWTEALQLMVQGEKRRLWIPANLAYEGRPGPQGMLVFDVELLEVRAAPPTPPSVARPPANAQRSDSGLAWIVLEAGTGDRRPAVTDAVEVHYAGWRSEDGELFDSSYTRGEPARFPVNRVIPGWTEGLQLMLVGEKRRFWIPASLAYEGNPRGPQGMLVFDVELLSIQ